MEKIRILLADDHPILREGLRAVLETQPDFEVIAEAANGHEAMRLALSLQPDILLLDLEMPQLDGVETICAYASNSLIPALSSSPPLITTSALSTRSRRARMGIY